MPGIMHLRTRRNAFHYILSNFDFVEEHNNHVLIKQVMNKTFFYHPDDFFLNSV